MAGFKLSGPLTVPMKLFIPTETRVKGVLKKTYPEEGVQIFGTFRTFGGTERVFNDSYVVEDTAVIETWYRPDISAECRIEVNGVPYEVRGTPENIEMRNQFLLIKVRAIKGGA